ncbi:MAG TPA: Gfo/Idh/MocA family oxidoreductase, partial [Roseiflexaceae bacterium]|nr:Gfo/Idh/MocA family oxidoreductase [Roseiflexaceae bacterium]
MDVIRWGIIGTGNIASQFARGLTALSDSDAKLVAVGSRTAESAQRFAERFGVPRAHSSYEALANDPDVDIVYISTPHSLHYDNTMLCLRAGKAVLCEKPFAINAREAAEMIAT